MLDAFIIQEIQRREREKQERMRDEPRPVKEIPERAPVPYIPPKGDERGNENYPDVIIIDYGSSRYEN